MSKFCMVGEEEWDCPNQYNREKRLVLEGGLDPGRRGNISRTEE